MVRATDQELRTNRPAGTLGKLLGLLTLRPYGSELLSPSASLALTFRALLVWLLVLAEGGAWGHFGYLFASYPQNIITGTVLFAVVASVVFVVDGSLMTFDQLGRPSAPTVGSGDDEGADNDSMVFKPSKASMWIGLPVRAGMVLLSLWVTTPFIAAWFMQADVADVLNRNHVLETSATRVQIAAGYGERISALEHSLSQLGTEYTNEAAGQLANGSGLRGIGPVAKTIQERAEAARRDLTSVVAEKEQELGLFDEAARTEDYATLARWGIVEPSLTPQSLWKTLASIRETPEFHQTDLAVKAVVGLLFIGLAILKLTESRHVRIYYSEWAHDQLSGALLKATPEEAAIILGTPAGKFLDDAIATWQREQRRRKDHAADAEAEQDARRVQAEARQLAETQAAADREHAQLLTQLEREHEVATAKAHLAEVQARAEFEARGAAERRESEVAKETKRLNQELALVEMESRQQVSDRRQSMIEGRLRDARRSLVEAEARLVGAREKLVIARESTAIHTASRKQALQRLADTALKADELNQHLKTNADALNAQLRPDPVSSAHLTKERATLQENCERLRELREALEQQIAALGEAIAMSETIERRDAEAVIECERERAVSVSQVQHLSEMIANHRIATLKAGEGGHE